MFSRSAISFFRTSSAFRTTSSVLMIPRIPLQSTNARSFSILTPHRPSISLGLSRTLPTPTTTPTTTTLPPTTDDLPLDLLPRITTHPALRFLQVRNGPRDTFDPSHFVRKRRFGFLARLRSRTGRAILKRRRAKGRKSLSH